MRRVMSSWLRVSAALPLLLILFLGPSVTISQAGSSPTFSGQATVVQASVPGVSTTLVDTGPLNPAGGAQEASLLDVALPNLLNADVAHATTIGQGDRSESEASLADVNLTAGGNSVSANLLASQAKAVCASTGPTASGSVQIARLIADGQPVVATGAPNQTVTLPNGRLVLNEQTPDPSSANHAGMTVNALHVVVSGVADLTIASAHADVTCPAPGTPPTCTGDDFMTGSGSMTTSSGGRADFAVAGAFTNGKWWGHVLFIDHGNGKRWKSTAMTGYGPGSSPTARHMEGDDDENGRSGRFKDDAADNGPQQGDDTESFQSDDGENESGHLGEGKMHHHTPCHDDD